MTGEASYVMKKILHFFSEQKDNPPPWWYPCMSTHQGPDGLPIAFPYSSKVTYRILLNYYLCTQGCLLS